MGNFVQRKLFESKFCVVTSQLQKIWEIMANKFSYSKVLNKNFTNMLYYKSSLCQSQYCNQLILVNYYYHNRKIFKIFNHYHTFVYNSFAWEHITRYIYNTVCTIQAHFFIARPYLHTVLLLLLL